MAKKYRNICVVGDDDQSIYKFRGADIRNILDFEKDFKDAKTIKLEQNYRSTQNILDGANAVIKNNLGRKGKKLWTDNGEGPKIHTFTGQNAYGEANFIADTIERLQMEGRGLSSFAVLYRNNAQSRVVEEVFFRRALRYVTVGSLRFYDRKEIKDVIAYLRLLNNPSDDISFKRVVNEPKRGIGKVTMERAGQLAAQKDLSLFDFIYQCADDIGKAAPKLLDFARMIADLKETVGTVPLDELIKTVLDVSGYMSALTSVDDVDAKSRIENLQEFIASAKNYEQDAVEPTFEEFLDNISLVSDIDSYDDDEESVTLMTMHAAKGLEFPVVFVCGMEEGLFPSLMSMSGEAEMEEERRVCYVAITRAREDLYLTNAKSRVTYGQTNYNKPSRFISEIPPQNLEDLTPSEEAKSFSYQPKKAKVYDFTSIFDEKIQKPKPQANLEYAVGERVKHKKFGEGTILVVQPVGNDVRLEVAFDTVGTKNLMAIYANLKKI